MLRRHRPLGDPGADRGGGLVTAPVHECSVQRRDGEPGFRETFPHEAPVVVDEEASREEIGPIPQSLLQRLEQTDPALPTTDEQDGAGLKRLRPALRDLPSLANVDRTPDLEEEASAVGFHRHRRYSRRPLAALALARDRGDRPLAVDVERVEVEQGGEFSEGVGLGDVLRAIGHHHRHRPSGRRWPGRRRVATDQGPPGALADLGATPVFPGLFERRDRRSAARAESSPSVRTSTHGARPESKRCQFHGDGSPITSACGHVPCRCRPPIGCTTKGCRRLDDESIPSRSRSAFAAVIVRVTTSISSPVTNASRSICSKGLPTSSAARRSAISIARMLAISATSPVRVRAHTASSDAEVLVARCHRRETSKAIET